jgi:hypothetical protein
MFVVLCSWFAFGEYFSHYLLVICFLDVPATKNEAQSTKNTDEVGNKAPRTTNISHENYPI